MSNQPDFERFYRDLFSALNNGNVKRVNQCLELLGPNCLKDSLKGYKALCAALKKRNKKIVELLLTEGVCVNHQDAYKNRMTPLHLSVSSGHFESVEKLLNNCALMNATDRHGRTPLFIATTNSKFKICKLLIDRGADVNICNHDGITPLHLASSNSQIKLVETFLESGAHINSVSRIDITNYHRAFPPNYYKGYTALHCAVQNGHYEVVQLLLRKNSDVNIKAIHGITPFHLAMERRYLMMASLLINYGADVNAVYSETTPYGCNIGSSALHFACLKRRDDVVNFLVNESIIIDAVDGLGRTPLYIACAAGLHVISKILLERGASVNFKDNMGQSILCSATKSHNFETVEVVLNYFPDVMDMSNREALKYSIDFSNQAIANKLIDYGFMINSEDSDYFRFLSVATEKSYIKIIERAVNSGISSEMLSELLFVATKSDQEDIVKLLLESGAKMCLTEPILPSSSSDHLCECSSPDISFNLSLYDRCTKNPIYFAVSNGNVKLLKMLLASEVNVDITFNLFLIAIKNNRDEIFKFLLEQKVYFANDLVLLKAAVKKMDESGYIITKLLLEKGNHDPNITDKKGQTYLHHSGNFATSKLLLSHGANVNAIDCYGETLLFVAISLGNEYYDKIDEFIEYLIENGAGFDYVNKHGETPLSIAWETNQYLSIECLLKYNADVNNVVLDFHIHDSLSDDIDLSFRESVVSSLEMHIVSLRAANLFVCDHYQALVGSLNNSYLESKYSYDFNKAMDEISELKNEMFNCKASYYDILMSNSEQFAKYVRDLSVEPALNLQDALVYPIYGRMIYGKYLKWKARMKLLGLSYEAIDCLSGQSLPVIVSEIIINYLNNQELDSLIQAFNLV